MLASLPSLNALRAFESAARHMSFTRAARELCVTQGAVSHQVKALEEHLGTRLFVRGRGSLALTLEGQRLFGVCEDALRKLSDAIEELTAPRRPRGLRLSVLPSFAARWLVPRLGDFQRRHPQVEVLLAPSTRLVDFARDDADAAIRFGGGRYPGLHVHPLMEDFLLPVCSPVVAERLGPRRATALRKASLLHDDHVGPWKAWLRAAKLDPRIGERGTIFQDASLMVQAAMAGQGIAMGRSVLVQDALDSGALVRPYDLCIPSGSTYYLVFPARSATNPAVVAFRDWLLEEAGAAPAGE